jgi:hypothetical protein
MDIFIDCYLCFTLHILTEKLRASNEINNLYVCGNIYNVLSYITSLRAPFPKI